MSADNWTICPKCKAKADAAAESAVERAERAYGKVPASEYAALLSEAEHPPELETTLGEYYELGVDEDSEFLVVYSCDCRRCGFHYEFRHKNKVKV